MNKLFGFVVSVALVVIAINMTYSNFPKTVEKQDQGIEEKVYPVIGRVTFTLDGFGTSVGFLIKEGDEYKIARYDQGTMAANEGYQPKFLTMVKFGNGKVVYNPLQVEKFN
jgi:hypothetical protein